MSRTAQLTLALATIVVLAGCGSSYTKSDFIARADAICAQALRDTRSVPPPTSQTLTDLARYAGQVLKVQRREQVSLQGLRLPAQSAAQAELLRQFLAAGTKVERAYAVLLAAAHRNDSSGVSTAEAELRAVPISALARRYGLRTCGGSGATVR